MTLQLAPDLERIKIGILCFDNYLEIKMKLFTDSQVEDMIKLRFGRVVDDPGSPTLTSYKAIGQVFGVSGT